MSLLTRVRIAFLTLIIHVPFITSAQQQEKNERKGEFYFSWGYNTEWYSNSNVHVSQPSLGNEYTFENIKGHDHRGWDEPFFQEALTIPQYNYRIGYFIDKSKNIAFELNFDHTKFIFADGQQTHIKGILKGRYVDSTIVFLRDSGFYYFLNNGANFFLFNIVKRANLVKSKNSKSWHWPCNSSCGEQFFQST